MAQIIELRLVTPEIKLLCIGYHEIKLWYEWLRYFVYLQINLIFILKLVKVSPASKNSQSKPRKNLLSTNERTEKLRVFITKDPSSGCIFIYYLRFLEKKSIWRKRFCRSISVLSYHLKKGLKCLLYNGNCLKEFRALAALNYKK